MFLVSFPHGILCFEHSNLAKAIAQAAKFNGRVDFAGVRVEAGEAGTEDYDTGLVKMLDGSGNAMVRWDSGDRTSTPTANINAIA